MQLISVLPIFLLCLLTFVSPLLLLVVPLNSATVQKVNELAPYLSILVSKKKNVDMP